MNHIAFRAVPRLAAFSLLACFVHGGELHGQTTAPNASSGGHATTGAPSSGAQSAGGSRQGGSATGSGATGGSAIGGNTTAGRGSTGSTAGGIAGNTAGNSTGNRTGNHGSSYAGGFAHGIRTQAQYGGFNGGGAYGSAGFDGAGAYGGAGAAGAYNAAGYGTPEVGSTFPGSVAPLPHWREVGTTPLPSPFRVNVDNVNANPPAVSVQPSAPSAPVTPIAISSDSGATAGSSNPGSAPGGPLTLGFEPPRSVPDQVGQSIAKRLGKLPSLHFAGPVRVDIAGRTAYLRGRVASEHERDLAERVVLLEAGIDDVVNMIEVGDGPSPALPPPPAPAARAANR